jgi:hypothetical protein
MVVIGACCPKFGFPEGMISGSFANILLFRLDSKISAAFAASTEISKGVGQVKPFFRPE